MAHAIQVTADLSILSTVLLTIVFIAQLYIFDFNILDSLDIADRGSKPCFKYDKICFLCKAYFMCYQIVTGGLQKVASWKF